MLDKIDAVLFDLDGTLVDSMWIWRSIDVEYLGRFQIPLPKGLQAEIEGMSFSETARYFKERFRLTDSVEKIKQDWNEMAWDKYAKEIPLKPGVREFITYCRQKGLKLGVATSNSRELVENVLTAHGIRDFFDVIVTGCDVAKGKPAPDVYLAAAEGCGALPDSCLVFEDVVQGILAGKAAGMKVCAVEDAYSLHQKEEKHRLSDYYIQDYFEIMAGTTLPGGVSE